EESHCQVAVPAQKPSDLSGLMTVVYSQMSRLAILGEVVPTTYFAQALAPLQHCLVLGRVERSVETRQPPISFLLVVRFPILPDLLPMLGDISPGLSPALLWVAFVVGSDVCYHAFLTPRHGVSPITQIEFRHGFHLQAVLALLGRFFGRLFGKQPI